MSNQPIAQALTELVDLVAQGKALDAFDRFYHPDLEKTDLDGITVKGLAANYEVGVKLISKVTKVRDFTAYPPVIVGDRSFLVWTLDFDHADNGPIKVTQVAVQDWQDGKIIRERFIA